MSEFRNPILYEKLKAFICAACNLLSLSSEKEQIPLIIRNKIKITDKGLSRSGVLDPVFLLFISQHQEELEKLPEFTECIECMTKDLQFAKRSKPIGDSDELIVILIYLIEKFQSFLFLEEVFTEFYKDYEECSYEDKCKFMAFFFLQNFECEVDKVDITANMRIRKLSNEEMLQSYEKRLLKMQSLFEKLYVLEINYINKRTTPGLPQNDPFSKIITALRLLKTGTIGVETIYYASVAWAPIRAEGIISGKEVYGNKYQLTIPEVEQFKKFVNDFLVYEIKESSPLNIALTRFNYAYERGRAEDKLIDMMVSFEALFLKGGEKAEFSYRLALRTAVLLENNGDERNKIFSSMREAYNARSKVVHGETMNIFLNEKSILAKDFVLQIEDYLRKSLNKFILLYKQGEKHDDILAELDKKILK
ncbi:MAG: HEPN domain-containing protein [bacterium]|nr:HEPN domain-containing protein [bacterium]